MRSKLFKTQSVNNLFVLKFKQYSFCNLYSVGRPTQPQKRENSKNSTANRRKQYPNSCYSIFNNIKCIKKNIFKLQIDFNMLVFLIIFQYMGQQFRFPLAQLDCENNILCKVISTLLKKKLWENSN